jgi:hypothetical protein
MEIKTISEETIVLNRSFNEIYVELFKIKNEILIVTLSPYGEFRGLIADKEKLI